MKRKITASGDRGGAGRTAAPTRRFCVSPEHPAKRGGWIMVEPRNLDPESGAERPAAMWRLLLESDNDKPLVIEVHEPVSGHPNRVHETLGGEAVAEFRKAFVAALARPAADRRIFRLTADAFAFIHGPGNAAGDYDFVYQGVAEKITRRFLKISREISRCPRLSR